MTATINIRPCPYCGRSQVSVFEGLLIDRLRCGNCGALGPSVRRPTNLSALAEVWNGRKPNVPALPVSVEIPTTYANPNESHAANR